MTRQTKTEARLALFTYIEGWYNPRRRHSALEYLSPINFESKHAARPSERGKHELPTAGVCVAVATPPVDNSAPGNLKSTTELSP